MDTPQKSSQKRSLKPYLVALACFAVGLGALYGKTPGLKSSTLPSDLKTIAPFELKNFDGKPVSIKDFSDSVVIVHFWAAWCAPCIPELPEVIAAAKKLPQDRNGKKIYWILISQDETVEKAKTILDPTTLPPNVVALMDPEAKISDAFGTYQFPETYVLGKKREIMAKWIGPQEWNAAWGEKALEGIQSISTQ